jgi:hypothetical protein
LAGQEPEEQSSVVFDSESSTGLFVGISTFEDRRFQEVPYAVDDAVDLAYLFVVELGLVRPEKAVLLLAGEPRKPQSSNHLIHLIQAGAFRKGARHSDIYEFLTELTITSGPRGLVLLTVATHGVSDQGVDVLVASDSRRNHMVRTGVAVSDLFNELAGARAERRLVLLDACRERLTQDTRGVEDSPMAPSFADAIAQAKGSVILSGATLGGFAYDDISRMNGVFTAAVLDGLGGQAPPGADGWITVRTLADYVQQRVVAWVQRNRPDHASKSLGIGRQIESTADSLPLALHPQASAERRRYRSRRTAALERFAQNQGKILTGALWDQIAERLPAESPEPEAGPLLDEIEALDGSERSQRSLRDFLRESTEQPMLPAPPPANVSLPPPDSTPLPRATEVARHRAADRVGGRLSSPRPPSARPQSSTAATVRAGQPPSSGAKAVPPHPEKTSDSLETGAASKLANRFSSGNSAASSKKPTWKSMRSQLPFVGTLVVLLSCFFWVIEYVPRQPKTPPNANEASVGAPNPRVALETARGRIVIELLPNTSPNTVRLFISDVVAGRYDRVAFQASGTSRKILLDQVSRRSKDEISTVVPRRGYVAVGNLFVSIQGSFGSSSVANSSDVPLGRVVLGMEVVDAIERERSGVWIDKATLLSPTAAP